MSLGHPLAFRHCMWSHQVIVWRKIKVVCAEPEQQVAVFKLNCSLWCPRHSGCVPLDVSFLTFSHDVEQLRAFWFPLRDRRPRNNAAINTRLYHNRAEYDGV